MKVDIMLDINKSTDYPAPHINKEQQQQHTLDVAVLTLIIPDVMQRLIVISISAILLTSLPVYFLLIPSFI